MALSVIRKQRVDYYRYIGRKANINGDYVSQYAERVTMYGSVQAVDRNLYQYLGLDFQKRYIRFYARTDLQDIGRGQSGDQIVFAGKRYQLLSNTEWINIDGWDGAIFVQI